MAQERTFTAILPRPAHVTDWSDTNAVLDQRLSELTDALGGEWQTEGPLFEADELSMHAWRTAEHKVSHCISLSLNSAPDGNMPDSVPDQLLFSLRVYEQRERGDPPQMSAFSANIWTGFIMLGAGTGAYATWRFTSNLVLSIFAGAVAFIAFLIASLFVRDRLERIFNRPPPAEPPSAKFVALADRVAQYMRKQSPFVGVREDT